ncbi:M15 family metallopeptidase [Anaerorhabdus sp.]|uniref:M15 family metallopeptidase n=1 Tax=Anaerorhabdus sp. TaxID=1872524 RepID=UPI002FC6883E
MTQQVKRKKVVKKGSHPTGTRKVKRKVRRIRKPVLYGLIAIVVLVVALFTVPKTIEDGKLKDLGYDKATISEIRKQKLTNLIIKNKYYSENLAASIVDKTLNKDYIELYVVSDSCDQREFVLYDRLIDKGYTEEQALNLFDNLTFFELTPLLVFDFQTDVQPYIDDAVAHSATNSFSKFELSNSYKVPYETTKPVVNQGSYDMLVNKTYYLDGSFAPPQLQDLSIQYASTGLQLDAPAAEGLKALCEGAREMGLRIFASSSYRSYDNQQALYDRYVKRDGQEDADTYSARAGFSEHQTGLTVDLSALDEDGKAVATFGESDEFLWTSQNCQKFGWILRFPEGKESITGYQYEPWHYRYLGVDLAQKVVDSKLTYDEYYELYMAPWNNEENNNALKNPSALSSKTEEPTESAEPTETPAA